MTLWDEELQPGLRLVNLAAKLLAEGRTEDALCVAIGAAELEDARPEPFSMIAAVYDSIKKGTESFQVAACERAIELNPDDQIAWHNLSLAQMRLYQLEQSLESANKAHRLDPSNPFPIQQAANVVSMLDDHETAIGLLTGALNLMIGRGDSPQLINDSQLARAINYLERGDLENYFLEYAHRFDTMRDRAGKLQASGLLWRPGQPIGKTVEVALEGGLGDQIQFVRLIEPFRRANPQVESVVVYCHEALKTLLAQLPFVDWVTSQELPPLDTHIASFDLVEFFCRLGSMNPFGAWPGQYLKARKAAEIRREHGKTAIGFCWQGNPRQAFDWARSMPFQPFLEWAEAHRDSCTFHSLQHGEKNFRLPDWIQDCDRDTFAELAEVVAACDVIVGPDTGVMHLAGAMAKPSVVLYAFHQDWRFKLKTQFYAKTFRHLKQAERGNWREVLSRLGPELDNLLDSAEQTELMEAMAR